MELMSGDQNLIEISLAGAEFKPLIKQWNGNVHNFFFDY